MPTYVYRREDGSTFEVQQRITEPALETCPTTGQPVKRVISSAGVIFKGSGFYQTDYVRKSGDEEKSGEKSEAKGENGKGDAKKESAKAGTSETKKASEKGEKSAAKGE